MPPKKRKGEEETAVPQRKGPRKTKPENGANSGAGASADNVIEDEASKIRVIDDFCAGFKRQDLQLGKLEGSMISGELLFCGGTNWDTVGRTHAPKGVKNRGGRNLWSPHRIAAMKGIRVRTVASGCCACHSMVISTDGKVYSWGRNEKGQLGHGDTLRRDVPTMIECFKEVNVVDAACGKSHSLILSEHGIVYAFGENKMGQLSLGHQSPCVPSPTRIMHKGPPIRRMACGAEFSMIVDVRGNLFSFGCPEYGQLGQNSDGKYFVSSNKLAYSAETKPRRVQVFIEKTRDGQVLPITDVEVVDVACGVNHTIIIDRKKRIFTWGFGGYGRLGHSEPKDEWVPRLLKGPFDAPNRGGTLIAAGSLFTMAVNELGVLYMWGQNKPTGEANMYPKPIQDLSGWQIRSLACCYRSIAIAADESMVAWGPSPTYGELGYGENKPKSSSVPQEVKSLEGLYIHKVAGGFAHTLMIARNDREEDQEKLSRIPNYTPGGPSTLD